MPPAKKPVAKKPAARRSGSAPATTETISVATRRQVERAATRLEKSLEEAQEALKAIRKDLGKGADRAYKDLTDAVGTLRRDAQRTNKLVAKELDRLRSAVTPARARTAAKPRASSARSTGSRAATKRTTKATTRAKSS
jgi:hypothetical protein